MIRVINALLAVIGGVGGALLLYWILNKLAEMLPQKWEERLKPWVFIAPALAAISLFLIYPAVRTIVWHTAWWRKRPVVPIAQPPSIAARASASRLGSSGSSAAAKRAPARSAAASATGFAPGA